MEPEFKWIIDATDDLLLRRIHVHNFESLLAGLKGIPAIGALHRDLLDFDELADKHNCLVTQYAPPERLLDYQRMVDELLESAKTTIDGSRSTVALVLDRMYSPEVKLVAASIDVGLASLLEDVIKLAEANGLFREAMDTAPWEESRGA
jgi:hypothetical protein